VFGNDGRYLIHLQTGEKAGKNLIDDDDRAGLHGSDRRTNTEQLFHDAVTDIDDIDPALAKVVVFDPLERLPVGVQHRTECKKCILLLIDRLLDVVYEALVLENLNLGMEYGGKLGTESST